MEKRYITKTKEELHTERTIISFMVLFMVIFYVGLFTILETAPFDYVESLGLKGTLPGFFLGVGEAIGFGIMVAICFYTFYFILYLFSPKAQSKKFVLRKIKRLESQSNSSYHKLIKLKDLIK